MSAWVFHDSYRTKAIAQKAGKDIMKLGLAKGVKIEPNGKKSRPYRLYILPLQTNDPK